jgi:cytochrome c biogenesis protein ResB
VELPDGRVLSAGLRDTDGDPELLVLEPNGGIAMTLSRGETSEADGLKIEYAGDSLLPSALVTELPQSEERAEGDPGARLQMTGAIYGTNDVSEGDADAAAAGGETSLTISGLATQPLRLEPGQSETVGDYQYTFLGQREFSGIQVKRDRSDYLVWAGAGLIVLGVMVTFWVPRRRLWAKINSSGTALAGQAPGHADYARELRELADRAGANIPEKEE